jgi:hypothetical protein
MSVKMWLIDADEANHFAFIVLEFLLAGEVPGRRIGDLPAGKIFAVEELNEVIGLHGSGKTSSQEECEERGTAHFGRTPEADGGWPGRCRD